jgi:Fe-S cluster biogenesis protein NfuA
VDESTKAHISKVCREILAPLVKADGGEMYLVRIDGDEVHIHLTGACAGCPGAAFTSDRVFLPALRTASPKARVVVTTGTRVPDGAEHCP